MKPVTGTLGQTSILPVRKRFQVAFPSLFPLGPQASYTKRFDSLTRRAPRRARLARASWVNGPNGNTNCFCLGLDKRPRPSPAEEHRRQPWPCSFDGGGGSHAGPPCLRTARASVPRSGSRWTGDICARTGAINPNRPDARCRRPWPHSPQRICFAHAHPVRGREQRVASRRIRRRASHTSAPSERQLYFL